MSEDRNKILSKAQKLKELAVRGVGGERENAKTFLATYMKKHNITESELSGYVASGNPLDLSDMTDEEFMFQMIKEMIPVGFGAVFGRYGDDKTQENTSADASQFLNRFLGLILSRVEKMNNKYRKQ
jgi:hypothetical protein